MVRALKARFVERLKPSNDGGRALTDSPFKRGTKRGPHQAEALPLSLLREDGFDSIRYRVAEAPRDRRLAVDRLRL